jgi:hypothetical protein
LLPTARHRIATQALGPQRAWLPNANKKPADQFTERAAELLDQIVREEPAKSLESATNKINKQ